MFTPNRIGTPLSPSATTVMLLGSGELGKEMAIAFQRLGVEVHAVDSYENAPAHQVAHAHYVIDMTNPDELRRLIAEVKPQFIVPEIEAVDTNVIDDCEAHGVTVIPTASDSRPPHTPSPPTPSNSNKPSPPWASPVWSNP